MRQFSQTARKNDFWLILGSQRLDSRSAHDLTHAPYCSSAGTAATHGGTASHLPPVLGQLGHQIPNPGDLLGVRGAGLGQPPH